MCRQMARLVFLGLVLLYASANAFRHPDWPIWRTTPEPRYEPTVDERVMVRTSKGVTVNTPKYLFVDVEGRPERNLASERAAHSRRSHTERHGAERERAQLALQIFCAFCFTSTKIMQPLFVQGSLMNHAEEDGRK